MEGLGLNSWIFFRFWKDFGGPGAETSLVFFRFWKDFGGPGAEIFDFLQVWERILEGLGLKPLIFFRFWIDLGGTAGFKYKKWSVFHQYLWIFVFVWARAVCGTRYWVGACGGYRAAVQKIHMRKIECGQGPAHDANFADFRIWGR